MSEQTVFQGKHGRIYRKGKRVVAEAISPSSIEALRLCGELWARLEKAEGELAKLKEPASGDSEGARAREAAESDASEVLRWTDHLCKPIDHMPQGAARRLAQAVLDPASLLPDMVWEESVRGCRCDTPYGPYTIRKLDQFYWSFGFDAHGYARSLEAAKAACDRDRRERVRKLFEVE